MAVEHHEILLARAEAHKILRDTALFALLTRFVRCKSAEILPNEQNASEGVIQLNSSHSATKVKAH